MTTSSEHRTTPLPHLGLGAVPRGGATRPPVTLLPDPEPRAVWCPMISVDDHLIEPRDVFDGRLARRFADGAPHVVELDDGREVWVFEDRVYSGTGLSAVVGRPPSEWNIGDPARFDEMRLGCWDVDHRIADMDISGVWASLCFPSSMAGFSGRIFAEATDKELGLACVRAYNDWYLDSWVAPYPERLIPLQIAWLADPDVAAADIEMNASRGFRALSFPERPDLLGYPSIQDERWQPILRACENTDTVVCLHAGSSTWLPISRPDAPLGAITTMFPVNSLVATADWIWAGIPARYPRLRIMLAEGGIGWVPMLRDRLEYIATHSGQSIVGASSWTNDLSPTEALLRNFWFCSLDDPSTMEVRDRIGVDHIMLEMDYPHSDSTWPDTQQHIQRRLSHLPTADVHKMAFENAAALFRHPVPPAHFAEERRSGAAGP
jgi:predicted TIM-barrel fold metal-dependent hydrolase